LTSGGFSKTFCRQFIGSIEQPVLLDDNHARGLVPWPTNSWLQVQIRVSTGVTIRSMVTLSITTLSKAIKMLQSVWRRTMPNVLGHADHCYAECHYAEFRHSECLLCWVLQCCRSLMLRVEVLSNSIMLNIVVLCVFINIHTHGQMDGWTDIQMDRPTDRKTGRQTDVQMISLTDG